MSAIRLGNLNSKVYVTTIAELTAALSANTHIIISAVTLTVSTTLTIPSGVVLEGSGPENTILQPAAGLTGTIITTLGGDNIVIKNLKIDGDSATWTADDDLIDIDASSDIYITNCHFTDTVTNSSAIDIVNNAQRVTISRCKFFSTSGEGIDINNGDYINIVGNQFLSVTDSPIVVGTASTHISITANHFLTSSGDISIGGDDVVFDSNIVDGINQLTIVTTDHVVVSNNRIMNAGADGIQVQGTTTNTAITGNHISDCTSDGITFTGTNTNNTITGNIIDTNTALGIVLTSTTVATVISNNIIKDNATSGINTDGAEDLIITDNNITGNTGVVTNVAATDNTIIRDNNASETLTASPVTAYASIVSVDSTGGAINPLTVPDLNEGSAGFILLIKSTVSANAITIIPTSIGSDMVGLATSYTNVILDAVGEWATFEWRGDAWNVVGTHSAATITA